MHDLKYLQISPLLKKNVNIKFSAHGRFWNNLHQVRSKQKYLKAK